MAGTMPSLDDPPPHRTVYASSSVATALHRRPWLRAVVAGLAYACVVGLVMGTARLPAPLLLPLISVVALAWAAFAVAMVWPTRLEIGAEGVSVRALGARRLTPWSDVEGVAPWTASYGRHRGFVVRGLRFERRGAPPLVVSLAFVRVNQAYPEAEGLLGAAEAHLCAARRTASPHPSLASRLAREGAGGREWRARLASVARNERVAYREASITPEALWHAVESAGAPEWIRIAAAVALRPTLDPAGRARLRAMSSASVSPRVRVALDAASDEHAPDDALDDVLETLDVGRATTARDG